MIAYPDFSLTLLFQGSLLLILPYLYILLPKLIAEETIVLGLLEGSSVEEKANYVLSKIKFANDEQKDEFAHKFCIRLVLALSDGKITYGEAVILAEMAYQELKRNNQL